MIWGPEHRVVRVEPAAEGAEGDWIAMRGAGDHIVAVGRYENKRDAIGAALLDLVRDRGQRIVRARAVMGEIALPAIMVHELGVDGSFVARPLAEDDLPSMAPPRCLTRAERLGLTAALRKKDDG